MLDACWTHIRLMPAVYDNQTINRPRAHARATPSAAGGRCPLPATRVPLADSQRFRRPYPDTPPLPDIVTAWGYGTGSKPR